MPSEALSDAALIARVAVGDDRHAFGELVKRHQSAVRATLRRLTHGNTALADDLAQETFLLAYRNIKSFRQEAQFSTWLYRIAYNAFLADARRMRESQLPEDDEGAVADAHAASDEPARTLAMDLERAMAVLSDAERAAIVQCYHNDLSHEEAARVLGCPVGTVKTHILRGKAKLKARLAGWEPEAGTA
jgi:RNA polymerase sigma-70 factor (ECF subfamily)